MIVSVIKFITLIWKTLSFPILGERCRFYPSCSDYLVDAVEGHGTIKGLYLGFKRVCSCHPLSKGGPDFVPENNNNKK